MAKRVKPIDELYKVVAEVGFTDTDDVIYCDCGDFRREAYPYTKKHVAELIAAMRQHAPHCGKATEIPLDPDKTGEELEAEAEAELRKLGWVV